MTDGPPPADRRSRVSLEHALKAVTQGEADWTSAQAEIVAMENGFASIRRPVRATELNPNRTVSGPTLFWMCDAVFFVATLATRGAGAETATTTTMTINFLRAAAPDAIQADCHILRSGKRLIVGEVRVFPVGSPEHIIANATGIFSAPPMK
jgi:uncharacterized protein (TIGR00369 family)